MPRTGRLIIYADSPLWVEIKARVETLEKVLAGSASTINRTERALMGGWDETGTQWIEGVRDKVQHIDEKLDVVASKTEKDILRARSDLTSAKEEVQAEVRATKKLFYSVLAGVWAVALAVITELANSYFGWFGSAHIVIHK